MIFVIASVILSFTIGAAIGMHIHRDRPIGDLRVDCSDPCDGPNLFLELDTDVQTLMRKNLVIFRVKLEDFLPQK